MVILINLLNNMKKFFMFILAILLLSSCAGSGSECSPKYKVTVKTCDGNTLEEYYPDDAYVVRGTAYLTIKGKSKSITGGIIIIERL